MKRSWWRTLLAALLLTAMCFTLAPGVMAQEQAVIYDGNSMAVFNRSRSEVIAAYQKAYNPANGYVEGNTGTYYSVPASTSAPYYKGELKKSTLEAMGGVTNFFRYLAGLNPTVVDTANNTSLQAQAMDRNFEHAHYISQSSKPSDMSQATWDEGFEKNHDIFAWGYHPLRAIKEWINEGYHGGWDTLGHRVALLTSDVSKVQYGYCGNVAIGAYDVRWDDSGFCGDFAAFPAPGPMPSWLVDPKYSSWSVELSPSIQLKDKSALTVTVTNLTTGSSYTCTKANDMIRFPYGSYTLFDFVQPGDYSGSAYTASYQVTITGLTDSASGKAAVIKYTVEFFSEQLASSVTSGWHKDNSGWWYQYADGSYPRNCWKYIDGNWYYFTNTGNVKAGWLQDGGTWYYFDKDGYMKTGWVKVDGNWYYFNSDGSIRTGWLRSGGTWYYFDENGYMKTGWVKVDGIWYYFNSDGSIHTGWLRDGSNWFYFSKDGYMKTGWARIDGSWYYFSQGGYMKTGWILDNGDWYYLKADGSMAADEWIGSYYVDASGRWIPDAVKEN